MSTLSANMYIYHMHAWFPKRSEEGIDTLEQELWAAVSYMLVLKTEPQISATVTSAKDQAISLVQYRQVFHS